MSKSKIAAVLALAFVCLVRCDQVANAKKAVLGSHCIGLGLSCSDGSLLAVLPLEYSLEQRVLIERNTVVDRRQRGDSRASKGEIGENSGGEEDREEGTEGLGAARWLSAESESRQYLHQVDDEAVALIVGIPADCRYVAQMLKRDAQAHRNKFGASIPVGQLADDLSAHLHSLVTGADTRPLAVDCIIAGGEGVLIKVDCSGSYQVIARGAVTDSFRGGGLHGEGDGVSEGGKEGGKEGGTEGEVGYSIEERRILKAVLQPSATQSWSQLTCEQAARVLRSIYLGLPCDDSSPDGPAWTEDQGLAKRRGRVVTWVMKTTPGSTRRNLQIGWVKSGGTMNDAQQPL